jgi:hypothetical protein
MHRGLRPHAFGRLLQRTDAPLLDLVEINVEAGLVELEMSQPFSASSIASSFNALARSAARARRLR